MERRLLSLLFYRDDRPHIIGNRIPGKIKISGIEDSWDFSHRLQIFTDSLTTYHLSLTTYHLPLTTITPHTAFPKTYGYFSNALRFPRCWCSFAAGLPLVS